MDGMYQPIVCWKTFQEKLKMAEDSEDKQIMLTDIGSRIEYIDIDSSEGYYKVIPPEYKQSSYHAKYGCICLSTCLLIRLQDSKLAY